ncbi:MAG: methyltransferase [Bryobacteraceae bacterium]
MPVDHLKLAAYLVFIGSWLVLLVVAALGAIPYLGRAADPTPIRPAVVIGTLLQAASVACITLTLPTGPLQPHRAELAAVLVLAPLAAALLVWVLRSTPRRREPETLVTTGAYGWLRHPMYAALFAMLLATGLLASSRLPFLLAVISYIAGTELRVAVEESDLAHKFPAEFPAYKLRTRWRYLPGVR